MPERFWVVVRHVTTGAVTVPLESADAENAYRYATTYGGAVLLVYTPDEVGADGQPDPNPGQDSE